MARLVVLQMLAALVAIVVLIAPQRLDVYVEGYAPQAGNIELFMAAPGHAFSADRRLQRELTPNEWATAHFWHRGLLPIKHLRIDLGQSPGEFGVAELRVKTRWSDRVLSAEALVDAIQTTAGIGPIRIESDAVYFESIGNDPYLALKPGHVLAGPSWGWMAGVGLLAVVLVSVVWLVATLLGFSGASAMRGVALVICMLGLTIMAGQKISERAFPGDSSQNYAMALNLVEHGVLAHSRQPSDPQPSNLREPLPPMTAAAWIMTLQATGVIGEVADMETRRGFWLFKQINLLWVFLGLTSTYLLARHLSGSMFVATLAVVGAYYFLYAVPNRIDTFYTELHGAALLTTSLYLLMLAYAKPSVWRYFAAGVAFGLLMLTKAAFVYVGVAFALIYPLWVWGWHRQNPGQVAEAVKLSSVVFLTALILTSSWVIRGYIHFDRIEMTSERNSHVVYMRALMNGMDTEEMKGMITLYGPFTMNRWVAGTSFERQDGDLQRAGRWARLNHGPSDFSGDDWAARRSGQPDQAISFHQAAAAEMIHQRKVHAELDVPFPNMQAGDVVSAKAFQMFQEQPMAHLMVSGLVFWKSFWTFSLAPNEFLKWNTAIQLRDGVNLAAGSALIILALVAFFTGRQQDFLLTAIPFGMLLFYALLSQGVDRYAVPLHPLMIVCLAVLLHRCILRRHD